MAQLANMASARDLGGLDLKLIFYSAQNNPENRSDQNKADYPIKNRHFSGSVLIWNSLMWVFRIFEQHKCYHDGGKNHCHQDDPEHELPLLFSPPIIVHFLAFLI
jgi:hypothetical protein